MIGWRGGIFKISTADSNYLANPSPGRFLPRSTINLGRPGPCLFEEAGPIPYDHEH
jgi:hypothetical protein